MNFTVRNPDTGVYQTLEVRPGNLVHTLRIELTDERGHPTGLTMYSSEAERFLTAMASIAEAWTLGRWTER